MSSFPASESLASEWEMGEDEGESDQEGVTYSCCGCCCCGGCCRGGPWAGNDCGSSSWKKETGGLKVSKKWSNRITEEL